MSSVPQLLFSIRSEGYAFLTIETLIARSPPSGGTLLQPPLPQPFSEAGMLNPTDTGPLGIVSRLLGRLVFSRPWNVWFFDVWRWITASNPGLQQIQFLCPSIDETDSEWFGTGTINDTDDPAVAIVTLSGQSRWGVEAAPTAGGSGYTAATFAITSAGGDGQAATGTATIQGGEVVALPVTFNGYGLVTPLVVTITGDGTGATGIAEPGRQWAVGDFIIWNDPTINSTTHLYQYEIDMITDIVPIDNTSATFTLQRRESGAAAGIAQYGSQLQAHATKHFYRLINKAFYAQLNVANGPQIFRFPWDNMTVAAVLATASGLSSSILFNLAPPPYLPGTTDPDFTVTPPAPGLRTMNGAAYTTLGISGGLTAGMRSQAIIGIQNNQNAGPDSIRTVHIRLQTAPTGPVSFNGNANACVVVYVVMINPDGTVWLIDTVVIDDGETESWSLANAPTIRQMPYHVLWPATAPNVDWPPNRLPSVTSLFSLPVVIDSTVTAPFKPDAIIDLIVAQVGTGVPGSDLTATVQT